MNTLKFPITTLSQAISLKNNFESTQAYIRAAFIDKTGLYTITNIKSNAYWYDSWYRDNEVVTEPRPKPEKKAGYKMQEDNWQIIDCNDFDSIEQIEACVEDEELYFIL